MSQESRAGWDPRQYLRYADQRGRAFTDLVARVGAEAPAYVVDLGCGPGNLTAGLARRWPQATVVGVDSSPEMIDAARRSESRVRATPALRGGSTGQEATGQEATGQEVAGQEVAGQEVAGQEAAGSPAGRLTFELGDLRDWRPTRPADVLISNATLQWVPGHLELLANLLETVAPGGWFAFQVPGNFDQPSHRLLSELAGEPRWSEVLAGQALERPASQDPEVYLAVLADLGCEVEAWETTYLFVLGGEDPVVEWMKGTGLRPYLRAVAAAGAEAEREFLEAYAERLREAYPRRSYGTVLPYRRVFAVARKAAA